MDPVLDTLQKAVAALRADSAVSVFTTRIFDRVPQKPEPDSPYISLGPHDAVTDEDAQADCIDGIELTFQIDVWSWGAGEADTRDEASKICHAVRQALHRKPLTLTGGAKVEPYHRQTRVFREGDGITNHGVITFDVLIDI